MYKKKFRTVARSINDAHINITVAGNVSNDLLYIILETGLNIIGQIAARIPMTLNIFPVSFS